MLKSQGYNLHGVQPVLLVGSIERALRFYEGVLGFERDFLDEGPPAHARVRSSDECEAGPVRLRLQEHLVGEGHWSLLYIHVGQNLDALFETCQAGGAETIFAPKEQPWNLREFSIRDPDGNRLIFAKSTLED